MVILVDRKRREKKTPRREFAITQIWEQYKTSHVGEFCWME